MEEEKKDKLERGSQLNIMGVLGIPLPTQASRHCNHNSVRSLHCNHGGFCSTEAEAELEEKIKKQEG